MKNEYKVTWDLYKTWARESAAKPPNIYFKIFFCITAIACAACELYFLATGIISPVSTDSLIFLAFFAFSIYRAFFRNIVLAHRQYKTLAARYQTKDWTRTITFNDEAIEIEEGGSSHKNEYKRIKEIKENGDKIYLILDDKMVIRLYKSAFVGCDWNECKAFIEQKT